MPRTKIVRLLISLMFASMPLAFYNVRISQRLMDLDQYARDGFQSKNVSSAEIQRILETYGQELGPKLRPDRAQDRIDEATREEPGIPEGLLPVIDWMRPLPNNNLDIGVPVSGQDKKLIEFSHTLGKSIGEFSRQSGSEVTIRVIVTRFPQDDASVDFQQVLAQEAGLSKDQIVFTTSSQSKFHRAFAINMLHKATNEDERSVLAIVDVDMDVGPRFLYTSLAVVKKSRFYFPIVFSQYRPSNVQLVEEYLGPQHKYSKHRGMWRDFGFGMYSISGADVAKYQLDESFQGWGGEDTEFYKRIRDDTLTTIHRDREYDLVHRWHAKYCELGSFVEADKLRTCVKSRNAMEGSNFWQFLVLLDTSDKSIFRQILATSTILSQIVASVIESKLYGLHMKSQSKRSANIEVIQALTSSKYEPGKAPQVLTSVEAEVAKESIGGILIGVTASRATFPTRVAEILQTWAKDLPQDIHVRFYVGDLTEKNTSYTDGSDADIANLALQAGISDKSMIVVMKGAQDNEYPLVQKAAAVLNHMDQATVQLDRQSDKSEIKWLFDVDDDTYVNVDGLKRFLSNRSIDQHTYIGRRGMGARKDREMLRKGGLTRPYCMGGTGILMAKDTFRVLVENIQKCIVDAKVTQDVVYDDVVFGTCLQRHLGIGCWDEKSYRSDTFAHNFHGSSHFPRNSALRDTITLHPHKTPGLMTKTHERFTRFVYTTAPMDESSGLLGFLLRVVWR